VLRLLIYANRTDVKVSVGEGLGVVIDPVGTSTATPVRGEGVSCPIAAKGQVYDHLVVVEMCLYIATPVGEDSSRFRLLRKRGEYLTTDVTFRTAGDRLTQ